MVKIKLAFRSGLLLVALLLSAACGRQPPPFECTDSIGCVHVAPGAPIKLGVLQARNHSQNFSLCAPLHVCLETDKVIEGAGDIVLSKLHDGEGTLSCLGVMQTHRAHRSKGKGVLTSLRQGLDRHTAFEVALKFLVGPRKFEPGGGKQRFYK